MKKPEMGGEHRRRLNRACASSGDMNDEKKRPDQADEAARANPAGLEIYATSHESCAVPVRRPRVGGSKIATALFRTRQRLL
jgi:hypothetical protein